MKEREIRRQILDYLALCGVTAWLSHDERHRPAAPGVPDILGVMRGTGRAVAIEVKRPGERATEAQAMFAARISEAGGLVLVATCVEDVKAKLYARR